MIKDMEHLPYEERLREVWEGILSMPMNTQRTEFKWVRPNSFQWCPVTEQGAFHWIMPARRNNSLPYYCKEISLQRHFQTIFSPTSKYTYTIYLSFKCLEIHPSQKRRKISSKLLQWLRLGWEKCVKEEKGLC